MNIQDCFCLGYVTKPFGYKGEVIFFLDVDDPSAYKDLDMVFIESRSKLIPFFIESINLRDKDAIVKFQDLSVEDAHGLVGSSLYLPLSVLPKLEGNKFYFHEVLGFEVIDVEKGNIGILEKILDQGPQPILCIQHPKGEVMVPLIDEFLEKVDRESKTITIKAPEGLIDFYLPLEDV